MRLPLEKIIQRKVLFVTGKGGIGKSLITAALGQYAASLGKRVCLIESTSHDQLAPLFGKEPVGHRLTLFEKNISGINLEASSNFRDFVVKHLGYERLFDKIFNRSITRSFISILPGLAELTLLGRIYYAAELSPENFDLVIFDAHSSGHFYNLITTPQAIIQSGLVGPVVKETQRLIDFYRSPDNAGLLLVANPEPLIITEVLDFIPKFQGANLMPLAGIIINRYLDEAGVAEELAALNSREPELAAACAFVTQRMENHSGAIKNLYRELRTIAPELDLFVLRDLGAVDEPLRPDFGKHWFNGESPHGFI